MRSTFLVLVLLASTNLHASEQIDLAVSGFRSAAAKGDAAAAMRALKPIEGADVTRIDPAVIPVSPEWEEVVVEMKRRTKSACETKDGEVAGACKLASVYEGWQTRLVKSKEAAVSAKPAAELPQATTPPDGPETLFESACSHFKSKKTAERLLAREKKVGEVSGYVSKTDMRSMGLIIVNSDEQLAALGKKYRAKTGKPFDLSKCPESAD